MSQQKSWRTRSLFRLLTHEMDWKRQLNINGWKQVTASITPKLLGSFLTQNEILVIITNYYYCC